MLLSIANHAVQLRKQAEAKKKAEQNRGKYGIYRKPAGYNYSPASAYVAYLVHLVVWIAAIIVCWQCNLPEGSRNKVISWIAAILLPEFYLAYAGVRKLIEPSYCSQAARDAGKAARAARAVTTTGPNGETVVLSGRRAAPRVGNRNNYTNADSFTRLTTVPLSPTSKANGSQPLVIKPDGHTWRGSAF